MLTWWVLWVPLHLGRSIHLLRWHLRRDPTLHLRLHLRLRLSCLRLRLCLRLHLLLIHIRRLLCKCSLRLVGGMCYRVEHDLLRVRGVGGGVGSVHRDRDGHTMRKVHGLLRDLLRVSNGHGDLMG